MKKVISVFLAMILMLCIVLSANAAPYTGAVTAEAALLVDMDTGEVLFSLNETQKMFPAGTTKLMTALVAYEMCPDLDATFIVEADALLGITYGNDKTLSPMLSPGEEITMRELLGAILVGAGNDAAAVAAYHCAGSSEAFVKAMNDKAASLNMTGTHFTNPHGRSGDEHYTTADDMIKLIGEILSKPELVKILNLESTTISENEIVGERVLMSGNLFYNGEETQKYEYGTGSLGGYTDLAGGCLVATAEKDGVKLACVVLGEPSDDGAWGIAKNLFEYAFSLTVTYTAAELFENVKLPEVEKYMITPVFDGVEITVSKYFDISEPTVVFEMPEDKDAVLGEAMYYAKDGTHLATIPVNIERTEPPVIVKVLKILLIIVIVLVVVFIAGAVVIMIMRMRYKKEKERKRALRDAQRAQMLQEEKENIDFSEFR